MHRETQGTHDALNLVPENGREARRVPSGQQLDAPFVPQRAPDEVNLLHQTLDYQ
jgi:hypothetical protein